MNGSTDGDDGDAAAVDVTVAVAVAVVAYDLILPDCVPRIRYFIYIFNIAGILIIRKSLSVKERNSPIFRQFD